MSIRVVCQQCHAKMDIKEELAGSTRKCPKCKTEFTVPKPDAEEPVDDAASSHSKIETVVDDDAGTLTDQMAIARQGKPAKSTSAEMSAATTHMEDEDDDEDDFMPSFVTGGAEKSAAKTPPPAKTDDDEPVLSIPKIPQTARPKFKAFDPDEFADDATPRPKKREVPASLEERRPQRSRFDEDEDSDLDAPPRRGGKSSGGAKRFSLPSPESTGLSDPSAPTTGGTKDRAQAARELRQALKDSALRAPQEAETTRSIAVDLSGLASEIGLKGVAIIVGAIVLLPAIYFIGDRMMGGGLRLPKLGYVTGTITYNGQPAVGAQVFFEPRDKNGNKTPKTRTSFGVANEKGEYTAMYMEGVEGVAVGSNRIWVQLQPPMVAPAEFSQASITLKDVTSGSQTMDFPLKGPEKRR